MIEYTLYKHPESKTFVTFIHGAGGSSAVWHKQIRAFSSNFNVLVLDLRGHGKSSYSDPNSKDIPEYSFDLIADDLIEVHDYLKIKKAHFVGISLGSIFIRYLAEKFPERMSGMTLAGAIMKLNLRTQFLMQVGVTFKRIIPYMILYRVFATAIMPRKNHKQSRALFVQEARKLNQKEFIRWFKLTAEVKHILKEFRKKSTVVPTYYIMGSEDYLFLPIIKKLILTQTSSKLTVVEKCGHVVNIEKAVVFNELAIENINELEAKQMLSN